jgi:hypothetical protein
MISMSMSQSILHHTARDFNGRRGIARRPNTWGDTPPRALSEENRL